MAEDDDEGADPTCFPLSAEDLTKVAKIITLVRGQLPAMRPADLRAAATVLLALERLPATSPGVEITFGFVQLNTDGNYGWADISFSRDEFRLGIGEHFYAPSVGGDTESRVAFETLAGGDWSEGDIDDWLSTAAVIAAHGQVDVEDFSDYDAVRWEDD